MSRLKNMISAEEGFDDLPRAPEAAPDVRDAPDVSGNGAEEDAKEGYAALRQRLAGGSGAHPAKDGDASGESGKAAGRGQKRRQKAQKAERREKEKAQRLAAEQQEKAQQAAEQAQAKARRVAERAERNAEQKRQKAERASARCGTNAPVQPAADAVPETGLSDLDAADRKIERRRRVLRIIPKILLLAACLYVVFLIYGAAVTQYAYREDGRIGPQVMTVDDIREKAAFDRMVAPYFACRALYQEILLLDERVAQGIEDRKVLAGEYGRLLSDADNKGDAEDLHDTLDALLKDTRLARYMQVLQQMNDWIDNNVRGYLQRVQILYLNGDMSVADEVVQIRAVMYENFRIITQAVSAFARVTNGVDATDIDTWSPETFVQEAVYGKR